MAFSQKGAGYKFREQIPDGAIKSALDDIASQTKAVSNQVNATPSGSTPAPQPIAALSVIAADGIFDVQIQDNGVVNRGIEYFLEYSLTPAFTQPLVIHLGTARNWRGNLGNQKLYWRAYSQYATSKPSAPVYFGSASSPTAVAGGGAAAGPVPHPSTGSGTASGNGTQGGAGYGHFPTRT